MLLKLDFKPGVVKDDTSLVAGYTFSDSDKVRFRRNLPEVVGGWERANRSGQTFTYPVRGCHSWAAASGDKVRALGTADKLYSFFGGVLTDITPVKYRGTLTDPFNTTNGSSTVVVTHQDHGLKVDDTVTYDLAGAVGGLTIDGNYTVSTVLSLDSYEIDAGSNASSTATGGGKVEVTATLDTGLVDGVGGTGYGTGTYGGGYYGVATSGDIYPRIWSCRNWGNNLLAIPRLGALYEWQPASTYNELVTTGDFASSTGWGLGTGWAISGGQAVASAGSASDMTQDVTGVLSGGLVYVLTCDVTVSAGTCQFKVTGDSGDVSEGDAFDKAGSYTRYFRAPSNPTTIKFYKDATFDGTIDNVSIKLASKAYRLQSAPQYSICGFVDPNRIVVLCGTVQYNGTYNAMCVRWSAQEDNTDWTPSDTNLSGEYVLAEGSRIVGAICTRGQNLIFTDSAVYSMRFTGDTGTVFSFDLIGTGCGLAGANAVAEHNGWVFWLAPNGQFYLYRGGEPQIIECPIRQDVIDNLALSQNEKIFCGVNSQFNEVNWFYADARDGNECSRCATYNFVEDHWVSHTFTISAWLKAGIDQYPFGFWTDGNIYYHEKGNSANGSAMSWYIQSGYIQAPQAGGNLMAVTKYFPDFESQSGTINLNLYTKLYPNQSATAYGPIEITTSSADLNFRTPAARELSFRWESGTNSMFMRFGQQSFDLTQTGMKR